VTDRDEIARRIARGIAAATPPAEVERRTRERRLSETRIIKDAVAAGHTVTLPSGAVIRPAGEATPHNDNSWDSAIADLEAQLQRRK
jgi:hypothetical protein